MSYESHESTRLALEEEIASLNAKLAAANEGIEAGMKVNADYHALHARHMKMAQEVGQLTRERDEAEAAVEMLRKLQTALTLTGHVCGIGPCHLCHTTVQSVDFLTRHQAAAVRRGREGE